MAIPLATAPNISAMMATFVGSFEKSLDEELEAGKVVSRSSRQLRADLATLRHLLFYAIAK